MARKRSRPTRPLTRAQRVRMWFFRSVAVGLGIMVGVGFFTFGYANGSSYLSNDPEACVNCHVMREQYNGWLKSSHGKVAVCNDCHTPHNFVGKWLTKADNGFHHSFAFTTGDFPDNIKAKEKSAQVVQDACVDCHKNLTGAVHMTRKADEQISCVQCHRNVGHMR